MVVRVIVLADAAVKAVRLAAIVPTGGLALKDVDVKSHKQESPVAVATGLFKMAPQHGLEPRTRWLTAKFKKYFMKPPESSWCN